MKPRELRKHHNHGIAGVRAYGGSLSWDNSNWRVYMNNMYVRAYALSEPRPGRIDPKETLVYSRAWTRHKLAAQDFYDICYAALLDAVPHRLEEPTPTIGSSK